jgi:aldehyde:ferredoxin oxidoreductase
LKFAGYDAIVIVGKADSWKYLYVSEDGAELMDGEFLKGMTSYTTQDALDAKHGRDVATVCIGPAGENRVRWATIQTNTENAAGQGGFGAVMGDKKLKAIAVKPGSKKVLIANPKKLIEEVKKISYELSPTGQNRVPLFQDFKRYRKRLSSCGFAACTGGIAGCLPPYTDKSPMHYTGDGSISGDKYCVGNCAPWLLNGDWGAEELNFEIAKLCDQLGLNHWEAFAGMNWFIQNCYNAGKLTTLLGETIELNKNGPAVYPKTEYHAGFSPELAVKFLRAVAYRQGEGDIWAEGTPRAAEKLGLTDEVWRTHKLGYGPHWDGRYLHEVHYPVWIVSALNWATQGRDPYSQQHGYPERYPSFVKEWAGETSMWGTPTIPYAEICKLGAKLYGAPHANDGWDKPELGYVDKEYVAVWHDHRAIIKSSVPVCDRQFPLLYDTTKTPPDIGYIDAEVNLFNAVVGTNWTLGDMHKAAERVFNVMRALHVRQGRTRAHDESVIQYFTQPSMWVNEPGPTAIEPEKFKALLERYYELRGWDKTTGWPTRAKLEELDLKDVADELARIGKLP